MAKDYFDRVREDPRTETRLARSVSVNELWEMREKIVISHKKVRLIEFYESFYDFISLVHEGAIIDKWNHPYVEYIRGYHKEWEERSPRKFRSKVNSAIDLYHSIKEQGMLFPLRMIVEDGRSFLYRGYRRLVILKVLGVKTAEVEYAIVHSHSSAQQPRDSQAAVVTL